MRYEELDLWIDPQTGDHYPFRVQFKGKEQAAGKLRVADFEHLKENAAKLTADADETYLHQLGGSLFDALFSDAAGKLYRRAVSQLPAGEDTGLRWRLRITPSEVADLPWELIYDPERKSFLTKSFSTLLTRYVDLDKAIRELELPLPIRVLVIVPGRTSASVQERLKITSELANLDKDIEVHVLDKDVTLTNIDRQLVAKQFHILHFVGDGAFVGDEAHLLFDDPAGDACVVSAQQLAYTFESHASLKVMLLHSSSSADKNSPSLRCVAEKLVHLGAVAAVSLRGRNSPKAAALFAQSFYYKLCVGPERGRVDIAVSHARMQLSGAAPDTPDFASPILFMRSPKGVVFGVAGAAVNTFEDLHTQKALAFTHDYNIQQLNKEGNVEAASKAKQEQSFVRARISRFYRWVLLSATLRIVAVALVLAVFVFLASHTKVLNAVRVDDYFNGVMRVWSEKPVRRLNENVRIISAQEKENGQLGPVGGTHWRAHHTKLIDGLSSVNVKPKVIVLDLGFKKAAPEYDATFAGSIQRAKNAGVSVVGAKKVGDDGRIAPNSGFSDELKDAFGETWGDVEVGGKLEMPLLAQFGLKGPYINMYEVAHLKTDATDLDHELEVDPSLALRAVMEYFGGDKAQAKAYFNEVDREVIVRTVNGDQRHIPVSRYGPSLEMLMEYADHEKVKEQNSDYAENYEWATSANATDKNQLQDRFMNSVVLIGYNTEEDSQAVVGEEGKRSGVEIHANAVSNILDNVYITPISPAANLLTIVGMFGVGVLVQTLKRYLRAGVKIEDLPFGSIAGKGIAALTVPLVIVCAVTIYLLAAYVVYSRYRYTFDMSYHLTALVFGYWFMKIINRIRRAV